MNTCLGRISTNIWLAILSISVMLVLVAGLPAAGHAQTASPTAAPYTPAGPPFTSPRSAFRQRHSWFLSAHLGIGSASYAADDFSTDPIEAGTLATFDLRFGGMLSPRLALAVEYWSDGHSYQDRTLIGQSPDASIVQNSYAASVYYWLTPKVWFGAGLGTSSMNAYYNDITEEFGEAATIMGALGYELVSRDRFAVDLSARFMSSSYDNDSANLSRSTFGLRLGLSWFR